MFVNLGLPMNKEKLADHKNDNCGNLDKEGKLKETSMNQAVNKSKSPPIPATFSPTYRVIDVDR